MRAAIIQPNYIPWRGYFDFISQVDIFVFYDDVQYTKNDWRNRNCIKTQHGLQWLTVPTNYSDITQRINKTLIEYQHKWQQKHCKSIYYTYNTSLFFEKYFTEYQNILMQNFATIAELNINLTKWLMQTLGIKTKTLLSSELASQGSKTERLISILQNIGATTYLSGMAAKAYLDINLFHKADISLEYKTYSYAPYPQLHGEFMGEVTVLDLLFNTGDKAPNYLHSLTPNLAG